MLFSRLLYKLSTTAITVRFAKRGCRVSADTAGFSPGADAVAPRAETNTMRNRPRSKSPMRAAASPSAQYQVEQEPGGHAEDRGDQCHRTGIPPLSSGVAAQLDDDRNHGAGSGNGNPCWRCTRRSRQKPRLPKPDMKDRDERCSRRQQRLRAGIPTRCALQPGRRRPRVAQREGSGGRAVVLRRRHCLRLQEGLPYERAQVIARCRT